MANNRDVELRIRARDYSQKTLKQVTDAISDLAQAQDAQRISAEKGETSAKELEASYRKLESAGQALLKLNSLVEVYKRQTAALEEQRVKLEATRAKQEELNKKYREADKVSKTMEAQMGRANRALEAQNKRFADAQARVGKAAAELQRYGISTENLGATQSKIAASVARVNTVLERQETIIAQAPAAAKRDAAAKLEEAKAAETLAAATAAAMARTEEAAYAQNKIIDSLRRQADQALATARNYSTLGRVVASTKLSTGSNLAGELGAIVSPAQAARSTLAGLEKQVNALAVVTRDADGKLVGASSALKNLQAAQQSAIGMARLVDTFRNQVAAVRAARDEFKSAKADVVNLANQMRSASGDTQGLGAKMQEAQQRLNAAAGALRSTGSAARDAQGALRNAGVDTRNLGAAEDRLRSSSQAAGNGIKELTEALKESSEASEDAGKKFSFFAENTRQSLSLFQRMRGEITALVTGFVGVQAAIGLASGAIDAYKLRQQTMIKLGTIVGNSQEAQGKEWKYITDIADDLGIKIEEVAKGYSTFAIAAKGAGLSLDETKKVFEAVSKTGRVFHLTADDMQGTFRAITQMLSKGTVHAEELTGQLAERLPGAVAKFAEGMKMTVPQLLKAMEQSEVTSRAVLNYAYEQSKAIDAEVETAKKGVDAMEARASNAMTFFKLALADSGFIDKYVEMLGKLTAYLNSPDGKEGAQKLGEAFTKLGDGIIWCIDHSDQLISLLEFMAGLKVLGMVVGLLEPLKKLGTIISTVGKIGDKIITFLTSFATRAAGATGAMRAIGLAAGALARALPYVGWALLAYDIGKIMYEQSETFRNACDEVVAFFKKMGLALVALVRTPTAAIQDLVYAVLRPVTTMFSDTLNKVARWIADVLKLIPGVGDSLAKWALDVADNLTKENRDMFQNVEGIYSDLGKDWKKINDEMVKKHGQSMSEVVKQALQAKADLLKADLAQATGFHYQDQKEGQGISERDQQIAANQKAIDAAQKKADKEQWASREALMRKNLKGRLALVDEQFAPQVKAAKDIGGPEGQKQLDQLNKLIALRKSSETNEFNASQRSKSTVDKRAKAIEALTEKYKELAAQVEVTETNQDPTSSLDDRKQAAINKLQEQYNKLRTDATKIGGKEGAALTDQLNALEQVNIKTTANKIELAEVERLQNKLNQLLSVRKSRIDEINSKREAGVISEDQQVAGVNQVNAQTQPGITDAMNQLGAQAQKSKDLLGPEKFAEINANLAATEASMKDLTGTYGQMNTQIVQGVIGSMNTGISTLVDNLTAVVQGTQSIGSAFQAAGVAMLQFFADLLKQIALAIIQQMILNAIAGMGGGLGSAGKAAGGVAGGTATAAAKHNGGVIGSKTTGGMQQRAINPGWFANAPRFHAGGLPGLKSDEVPTILQKGEEVLSKNNPNNILNQNRSSNSSADPSNMRFVLLDDRARVPEAMNTADGERAVLQILQRNAPSVRQIVKSSNKKGRG